MPATLAYGSHGPSRTIQEARSYGQPDRSARRHQPTLGFTTLEDETTVDELPLSGELPSWLSGSLLRTGPAKFEVGEERMRHWFDGLAMLHRFTVQDGRVSYGNRFLQSRSYRAAKEQGRMVYGEFATDPCRSLFKRVQTLFAPAGRCRTTPTSTSRDWASASSR